MFQALFVTPAVVFIVVLEAFALVFHDVPLLIDESLSPHGFDDALERRKPTHSSLMVLAPVHVIRRMSSAWLQWGDQVANI